MNQAAEIIPFNPNEIKPFSAFESQLAKLKDDNNKAVFDYASPKGNKEARSHIFVIRKVKGELERARKDAKDAALQYGRLVDGEAKRINGELENMIEIHEKPLREIEEREAARVEAIKARIVMLDDYKVLPADAPAEHLRIKLSAVEAFALDDSLEEFKAVAAIAKDQALTEINGRLAARVKYEEEQAELARLREEAAERQRKDHEERIAREAAERATREAEAKAQREREAAERQQQERERAQQEEARRQELALETARREKAEAEARAANAEKVAKENAESRQREEQEVARREAEKREANTRHQAKVNNAAVSALVAAGVSEDMAKLAITAIAQRKVPAVAISY